MSANAESKQQTAMQQAMALWNVMETKLRQALAASAPMSVQALYKTPDIHRVARSQQQVRDAIVSFGKRHAVIKKEIPEDKRDGDNSASRIGYIWNPDFKGVLKPRPVSSRQQAVMNSSEVKTTRFAVPRPAEFAVKEHPLELNVNGVTLLVGAGAVISVDHNEKTGDGRVIIKI
jgi:hypothetical protein